MSEKDNNSIDETNDEGPRDSRLQSFLRQASAIIAAEKGFNNVAKAKLDDLAQRLHLPEELFEQGLQELQNSNSPVGDLTDYEKGFIKFLIHEFSQKPKGAVLSISMEEKAVAYANDRFGISANRAEQLIDYQASESGIGRLSRTDAREFGRQMIHDIIGEQLLMDAKTEDRIFRIGRRWGCDVLEVEEMITTALARNADAVRREQRRPKILGVATMAVLVMIGLSGWWFFENREAIFGKTVVKRDPVPVVADPIAEPDPEETKSVLETTFPEFAESLSSEDFVVRGDAIEAMTEQALSSQKENGNQFDALGAWYLQEGDPQVADRFEQSIQSALKSEPVSSRNNALMLPLSRRKSSAGYLRLKSVNGSVRAKRNSESNSQNTVSVNDDASRNCNRKQAVESGDPEFVAGSWPQFDPRRSFGKTDANETWHQRTTAVFESQRANDYSCRQDSVAKHGKFDSNGDRVRG